MALSIAEMERSAQRLKADIAAYGQQAQGLYKRELNWRYQEKVAHDLAIKQRDKRIKGRFDAAVKEDPGLLFALKYENLEATIMDLEKGAEAQEGTIKILRKSGHEDKVGPVEEKLKDFQRRAADLQAKQQALADAYFAEFEAVPVPAEPDDRMA